MMNREENEIKDQRIERRKREKARKGEREQVAEKLEATKNGEVAMKKMKVVTMCN
jgi:hypothetical protein